MATNVQTRAAHHARLTVTDPARSREFYGLLGFQVAMEFPDGALVSNGDLRLGLRTGPDPARARRDARRDRGPRAGLQAVRADAGGPGRHPDRVDRPARLSAHAARRTARS